MDIRGKVEAKLVLILIYFIEAQDLLSHFLQSAILTGIRNKKEPLTKECHKADFHQ